MILASGTVEAIGKKKACVAVDGKNGEQLIINIERGEKVAVPIEHASDLADKGLIEAVEIPVELTPVEEDNGN